MRHVLLSLILGSFFLLPATAAIADVEIDWTVTPPLTGEVVGDEVHIEGPWHHRLLTVDDPGIDRDVYVVRATIRFENVVGTGFLEMWSYFPDGGAFFSRTLTESGPMAALSGDSSEREFELPFLLNGASVPERVEINVVLPDRGDVWIGSLVLEGFGGSSHWWSVRQPRAGPTSPPNQR